MTLPWRSLCDPHRDALLEVAARRQVGPGAASPDLRKALDHVDRCRRCEADLAALSLIVGALRRQRAELARAEPPADGWLRLRSRLAATRRQPSLLVSGVPGLLAALGICLALVGPGVLRGDQPRRYDDASLAGPPTQAAIAFEQGRDRNPPPAATVPLAETADAPGGPDDLARAVSMLSSIPPDQAILNEPDVVPQPAPTGADRR